MVCCLAILSCLLLSWTGISSSAVYPENTERDLRYDLFRNYDKLVRPVKNPQTPVNVQVSMTPLMIREVDEKHQNLVLESWILMRWKDEYLTWDPDKYENLKALRLAPSEVWKPDIALYTASPVTGLFPSATTQVLIYPTGEVLWVPPYIINSRCPFSKQTDKSYVVCNIKFGSWTFSANELNPTLNSTEVDISVFQDINPEWKLMDIKSNRVSSFYPCCPGEDYPSLHFNVTLKRRFPDKKQEWSLGY